MNISMFSISKVPNKANVVLHVNYLVFQKYDFQLMKCLVFFMSGPRKMISWLMTKPKK